jgi:hypothetical protein
LYLDELDLDLGSRFSDFTQITPDNGKNILQHLENDDFHPKTFDFERLERS